MTNYTYKLVYTPATEDNCIATAKDINFLCTDGKVHVRLRDYDHEEVIHGFVDKLTYAVTYLFQRVVVQESVTNATIEKLFNSDDSLKIINDWVINMFSEAGKECKGLKISKNYRKIKKAKETPLGSFLPGTCPLVNGVTFGDIRFLDTSMNFMDFGTLLLDDSIDIVITKEITKDRYTKFSNKKKKVSKKELEYIPLF